MTDQAPQDGRRRSVVEEDPANLDPAHPFLLHRVLKLSNLIGRPFFAHFAERHDLTMNDLRILMALTPMKEGAAHELAQATGMHPMNVSRAVGRLRRQGRIVERADPDNRRRKILTPTTAGQRLFNEIAPHVKALSEFVFEPLTAEEAEILGRLVDALTLRLELVDANSTVPIDAEELARQTSDGETAETGEDVGAPVLRAGGQAS